MPRQIRIVCLHKVAVLCFVNNGKTQHRARARLIYKTMYCDAHHFISLAENRVKDLVSVTPQLLNMAKLLLFKSAVICTIQSSSASQLVIGIY